MSLVCENITKRFGGLTAVSHFEGSFAAGAITGIIGPNGSGKSVLINVISGYYKPEEGKVIFDQKDITGSNSHTVARLGIARTFQHMRPLMRGTVIQNVALGALFGRESSAMKTAMSEAHQICKEMEFGELLSKSSDNLTTYERKKVEIARAVATKPRIVMLDEVMAGLNPAEVEHFVKMIKSIRDNRRATIIVVEHILSAVMSLCDRVIVLSNGRKIAEGPPQEIVQDVRVIDVYLGRGLASVTG
jgi:branched-chain amino acid transport system ATP-binding protein